MKAIFISDLHLGAKYIADPRAHEVRVVDFLRSVGSDVTELYLLGDILDYWFEYRNVVPRGYVRFFGELAQLSDNGVQITWLTGNHDIWLFDYLRDELGIEVIDSPYIKREISGKKFLLSHGDRIGYAKPSFKLICSVFRNKLCQKLYASLHPRLTIPFALNWSKSSRGEEYLPSDNTCKHESRIISDADNLAVNNPGTYAVVEGHHHVAIDTVLPDSQARLMVLGDWINKFTYAEFDGKTLTLKQYKN